MQKQTKSYRVDSVCCWHLTSHQVLFELPLLFFRLKILPFVKKKQQQKRFDAGFWLHVYIHMEVELLLLKILLDFCPCHYNIICVGVSLWWLCAVVSNVTQYKEVLLKII